MSSADDLEQFKRDLQARVVANSLNAHDGTLGFQSTLLDIHWSLLAFFQLHFEEMLKSYSAIVVATAQQQADQRQELHAAIAGLSTQLGIHQEQLASYIAQLPLDDRARLIALVERHEQILNAEAGNGEP